MIDINYVIKELTIELRKKNNLKLPDAIIASTAYFLNTSLVTVDKVFTKIKEIDVLFYQK